MSKYEPLWQWLQNNAADSIKMSFGQVEQIAGFPIDHSFLSYKKELISFGYRVGKISLKEQTVVFEKIMETMQ